MAEETSDRPVERTRVYYTRQHIPDRPVERTGVPEHTSYTTYMLQGYDIISRERTDDVMYDIIKY
jgi:hypothetical protein